MKSLLLPAAFLISGCFVSHKKIETNLDHVIRFETTNSPCLDAMIVNMRSGMCENITSDKDDITGVYYWCEDSDSSKTSWNTSKFYAVTHDTYSTIVNDSKYNDLGLSEKIPLCADIHLLVFIHE